MLHIFLPDDISSKNPRDFSKFSVSIISIFSIFKQFFRHFRAFFRPIFRDFLAKLARFDQIAKTINVLKVGKNKSPNSSKLSNKPNKIKNKKPILDKKFK